MPHGCFVDEIGLLLASPIELPLYKGIAINGMMKLFSLNGNVENGLENGLHLIKQTQLEQHLFN